MLLLLAAFALAFTACEEEAIELKEEICEDTDPDDALIAFFDPYTGTIYVTPDFKDKIADILGLETIPGSGEPFYLYQAFTMSGAAVTVEAKLNVVDGLEALQAIAGAVDQQVEKDAQEIGSPDVLASSRTRVGYKCEKIGNDRTTRCHAFPNHSSNSRLLDRFVCVKGASTSECTDWNAVVGYAYEYGNANCSGDPRSKRPLRGFTCH